MFDESIIALVGLDEIRFLNPAMVGDSISLHIEVLAKHPTSDGTRGTVNLAWRCTSQDDRDILTARATMLCRAQPAV